MRLGHLADEIFWEPFEGSHMVSQMVSEINLSGERAEIESDSLSSKRYSETSCEIDGLRARARCGLEDAPPNTRDA